MKTFQAAWNHRPGRHLGARELHSRCVHSAESVPAEKATTQGGFGAPCARARGRRNRFRLLAGHALSGAVRNASRHAGGASGPGRRDTVRAGRDPHGSAAHRPLHGPHARANGEAPRGGPDRPLERLSPLAEGGRGDDRRGQGGVHVHGHVQSGLAVDDAARPDRRDRGCRPRVRARAAGRARLPAGQCTASLPLDRRRDGGSGLVAGAGRRASRDRSPHPETDPRRRRV